MKKNERIYEKLLVFTWFGYMWIIEEKIQLFVKIYIYDW